MLLRYIFIWSENWQKEEEIIKSVKWAVNNKLVFIGGGKGETVAWRWWYHEWKLEEVTCGRFRETNCGKTNMSLFRICFVPFLHRENYFPIFVFQWTAVGLSGPPGPPAPPTPPGPARVLSPPVPAPRCAPGGATTPPRPTEAQSARGPRWREGGTGRGGRAQLQSAMRRSRKVG